MTTFRIGDLPIDLQTLARGARTPPVENLHKDWDAPLGAPSPLEPPPPDGLSDGERQDLAAFEAEGWQFKGPDSDWPAVGEGLKAGLLVRRPSGNLAILENRILVQFKPGVPLEKIATYLGRYPKSEALQFGQDLYQVELPPPTSSLAGQLQEELASFAGSGDVVFAEPSLLSARRAGKHPVASTSASECQWGLLKMAAVWPRSRGCGMRVAIIDQGFYVDDVGIVGNVDTTAVIGSDGLLVEGGAMAKVAHGTSCAGLVGAQPGPQSFVTGAAPCSRLILVAVPMTPNSKDLAVALSFCAGKAGADVICCSLLVNEMSADNVLQIAIDGVLGSGRKGMGSPIFWTVSDDDVVIPAGSVNTYPKIISVGQCDCNGNRQPCGFGPELTFLAPGFGVTAINYLSPGNRAINQLWGASLATPIAGGIAALILSLQPKLGWQEVKALLVNSCGKRTTSTPNPRTGAGVISAALAVPQPQPVTHLLEAFGSWWSGFLRRVRKASP